jgi:hypothetical protein
MSGAGEIMDFLEPMVYSRSENGTCVAIASPTCGAAGWKAQGAGFAPPQNSLTHGVCIQSIHNAVTKLRPEWH